MCHISILVYGCKISDMELINANAAMIAGTYKADVQCYVGNYMSQETMENTVINICDFNTETWSIQSIKCARKFFIDGGAVS